MVFRRGGTNIKLHKTPLPGSSDSRFLTICFSDSLREVLAEMTGIWAGGAEQTGSFEEPVKHLCVTVAMKTSLQNFVSFAYPKAVALGFANAMMGIKQKDVDDLVVSAMCELGNITCGNAASRLALCGIPCTVEPPRPNWVVLSRGQEWYSMHTDCGPVFLTIQNQL